MAKLAIATALVFGAAATGVADPRTHPSQGPGEAVTSAEGARTASRSVPLPRRLYQMRAPRLSHHES
jgi:hypothetical protein